MVFTQIFVSYESVYIVQAEHLCIFVQIVWENIKMTVTSGYIDGLTGK